jgi:hypothetical protein
MTAQPMEARLDEPREPGIGELIARLTRDVSTLLQNEIELAKREVKDNVAHLERQTAWIAIGALLAVVALGTLVAAVVLALAKTLAPWAASLVAAVIAGGVAAAFVLKGMSGLKRAELAPKRTIQTIRETVSGEQKP